MCIPRQRRASNSRRIGRAPVRVLAAAALWLGGCADLGPALMAGLPQLTADATPVEESDYERGKQALAAERLGLAIVHFRAALDGAPDSVEAWNGLGAAFDRLGRFDLSLRAYGRALAIDPRSAQTLNNLGYSFLLQGRYEQAEAYLRHAAAQGDDDGRILENRRLAEDALARASGLRPGEIDPATASDPQAVGIGFKPRLQRIGKATKRLVTQAPPGHRACAASCTQVRRRDNWALASPARARPGASIFPGGLLPAFLAAPMSLE